LLQIKGKCGGKKNKKKSQPDGADVKYFLIRRKIMVADAQFHEGKGEKEGKKKKLSITDFKKT